MKMMNELLASSGSHSIGQVCLYRAVTVTERPFSRSPLAVGHGRAAHGCPVKHRAHTPKPGTDSEPPFPKSQVQSAPLSGLPAGTPQQEHREETRTACCPARQLCCCCCCCCVRGCPLPHCSSTRRCWLIQAEGTVSCAAAARGSTQRRRKGPRQVCRRSAALLRGHLSDGLQC